MQPKPVTAEPANQIPKVVPALFIVLFLVSGLIMIVFSPNVFTAPDTSVFNGKWAREFESAFDEHLPIRQLAINTWGVIEYLAFGEGRTGVLIGSDGWLYTSEDFLFYPDWKEALSEKVELAVQANDTLAAYGINLVVVVIPDKSRVYPEHLAGYSYPSYNLSRYENFMTELVENDVSVVNLLEAMLEAKDKAPVFLRTDTHWTPFGAKVAAGVLSDTIKAEELLPSLGSTTFYLEEGTRLAHEGDLLNYLPLGGFDLGPEPDTIIERAYTHRDSGGGLFEQQIIPITLVGTSYSANPTWQFEGALKEELGADVLNYADEGLGPVIPLENFLDDLPGMSNTPELVIWEVPERFLFVSY